MSYFIQASQAPLEIRRASKASLADHSPADLKKKSPVSKIRFACRGRQIFHFLNFFHFGAPRQRRCAGFATDRHPSSPSFTRGSALYFDFRWSSSVSFPVSTPIFIFGCWPTLSEQTHSEAKRMSSEMNPQYRPSLHFPGTSFVQS